MRCIAHRSIVSPCLFHRLRIAAHRRQRCITADAVERLGAWKRQAKRPIADRASGMVYACVAMSSIGWQALVLVITHARGWRGARTFNISTQTRMAPVVGTGLLTTPSADAGRVGGVLDWPPTARIIIRPTRIENRRLRAVHVRHGFERRVVDRVWVGPLTDQ